MMKLFPTFSFWLNFFFRYSDLFFAKCLVFTDVTFYCFSQAHSTGQQAHLPLHREDPQLSPLQVIILGQDQGMLIRIGKTCINIHLQENKFRFLNFFKKN